MIRAPTVAGIAVASTLALTLGAPTGANRSTASLPALAIVAQRGPANACSLTPAQERTALDAFDKMLPVFFHPRCTNCHGGLNPYVDPQVGRHLGGQMVDSVTGDPLPDSACQDCHGELPGWTLPGQAMFFVGKSPRDLCIQLKQFAPGGGADFVRHIEHEQPIKFIEAAFLGMRALNTLGAATYEGATGLPHSPERPPGTFGGLVSQAQAWVDAIGAGWQESPECGCDLGGAWHGTVTALAVFNGVGLPGTMTITSSATVMLERVPTPSFASGRRVQVYRSTGGTVRWDALVSGGCRGMNGGTMALDTTDVDGNPMLELRIEEGSNGTLIYQPTTGSQPDLWAPIFNVQCVMSGTSIALPTTNLLPTWWHYDIPDPPTSTNIDLLEGSYTWVAGPGSSVLWKWKLKRIR